MRTLELPPGKTCLEEGQIHGETFRPLIQELVAIRTELAMDFGFSSVQQLMKCARQHAPILESFDEDLSHEILGISQGSGCSAEEIILLNHYTDLRDLGSQPNRAPIPQRDCGDDCSLIYTPTACGPLLGQTWDMHGSATPYVLALRIPESVARPAALALTVVGCIGMAGLNQHGVGITINNLRSRDATVGVVWSALVRRALRGKTAHQAYQLFNNSSIGSGHHYFMADSTTAYGIETSGTQKQTIYHNEGTPFIHTNHCLNSDIERHTEVPQESTTHLRYAELDREMQQSPIKNIDGLWQQLGSHAAYPHGICMHLSTPQNPHGTATCGAIAMDLSRNTAYIATGCVNHSTPHRITL